jgi:hypothetical protein
MNDKAKIVPMTKPCDSGQNDAKGGEALATRCCFVFGTVIPELRNAAHFSVIAQDFAGWLCSKSSALNMLTEIVDCAEHLEKH